MKKTEYVLGIDIGSTTNKVVLLKNDRCFPIIYKDYQRHYANQSEMLFNMLKKLSNKIDIINQTTVFITGSGGTSYAPHLNARFIQEVNAICYYARKRYAHINTMIDIGGQDSKIVIFKKNSQQNQKRMFASMNEKCAGGTGIIIDRILQKLGIDFDDLNKYSFDANKTHPVAAKCGIFAESDINSLQKQGVAVDECINSLFNAIIQQNISTLSKGRMLKPPVLLLGGPNTFCKALQDAWRHNLYRIWDEEGLEYNKNASENLVFSPDDSQYFTAMGAALYGSFEYADTKDFIFEGFSHLHEYIKDAQENIKAEMGIPGFKRGEERIHEFIKQYEPEKPTIINNNYSNKKKTDIFIGLDSGSTSTKAVALDEDGNLLAKSYKLSKQNPLDESILVLDSLNQKLASNRIIFSVKSLSITGYAKDLLKGILGADTDIVETVAHMKAGTFFYGDIDVIMDVGGQDIKIILLKNNMVYDFKLNNQCSAGNGFYLQSTAKRFGIDIEQYAETAFTAKYMPNFSCGCAVFMESEIVHFQQIGWKNNEILAGLANVLPKNIWEYIVQTPNLMDFGRIFLLQGGTQRNLAVVKAEVDYIKGRVPEAEVIVHKYCGETGAIGAALQGMEEYKSEDSNRDSSFIGFEELKHIRYSIKRDSDTQCFYCNNKCLRSYIYVENNKENKKYIIAPCEKGSADNKSIMEKINKKISDIERNNPNFVTFLKKELFRPRDDIKNIKKQNGLRIGIPRILNMWSMAPFFTAYLQAIGIKKENIIFSDYTNDKLWKEGSKYNCADLCFPGKYGVSHILNLFNKNDIDIIFNPCIITVFSEITNNIGSFSCAIVSSNPEVLKASFTKERDLLKEKNIYYFNPIFHMDNDCLFEYELYHAFKKIMKIKNSENHDAYIVAKKAYHDFKRDIRGKALAILNSLMKDNRMGILFLCRPYQYDTGLNHQIALELQRFGYPIFCIDSLPTDSKLLDTLFRDELDAGIINNPFDISDVWKYSASANTNIKVWAAKFATRHPNLAVVDFNNFRCGHDATILKLIENIMRASNTPYFTFHDMDQNRPSGSINIRLQTIHFYLQDLQKSNRVNLKARLGEN